MKSCLSGISFRSKAFEMYGDEGRNGVLVIKTKPPHLTNEFKYRYKNDEDDTNVEVFVDPNIENVWVSKYKSIEVNKIDKNTTDNELKKLGVRSPARPRFRAR